MSKSPKQALLIAVTHAVRKGLGLDPAPRRKKAGEPPFWPAVATVMRYLIGEGYEHRNIPRNQYSTAVEGLSQEALSALVASVSSEAYQSAVDHVLKHDRAPEGAPPVIPGVNDGGSKKEWSPPPSRSDDPGTRVQERKEEILRRHDRKVADALVEQAAVTDLLVEAVTKGAREAPPIVIRPVPTIIVDPGVHEEMPNALLGDIHGGAQIVPEEVGGLGEFNMKIFRRRLDRYQDCILGTIDVHRRTAKIRRMVIWMLGDMIEGEVIFDGQAFRIELIVVDQVFEVSSYLVGWLLGILASGLVETIDIICIPGNHGRTTHRKGATKFHANWDYVLYRHMAEVLRNEPRIKWFVPKTWFAIVEMMGWRIYGTHGDVIKAWMGIPFYGIQRHDARTTLLLQSVDLNYQYWVCGDKHVSATIPRVAGAQIMNGSIVGGSDFSMHQLGTASEPMQTMFGINEKHGKTWQYDYVLERRDPEEIRKHLAFTSIGQ